jgi:hypothetical protein
VWGTWLCLAPGTDVRGVFDFMRWEDEVLEPPQPVRVNADVPLGCAMPQHVRKHRLPVGRLLCGALGCA